MIPHRKGCGYESETDTNQKSKPDKATILIYRNSNLELEIRTRI